MMPDAIGMAGDIIQASAALAGLMIVFVGSAVASFGTFTREQQNAVRDVHRQRAWFGFWGAILALAAALAAVIAKWNGLNGLAIAAGYLLIASLGWAGVCVWATAREIK
jgi:hypothetical protein